MALPPGFRFHPTDEELVAYYLKRKVAGRSIEFNIITEIDLYKQEPWDLPEKSFLPGSDMEWYFFSPRDKKYPNGLRTNRATEAGYWKATGKDRNVKKAGRIVGMKKTLVFYRGRAPHGERTDWVMHEYRLDEEECEKVHASQDLFVLCRVFKKSGVGPRSGEDRGPQTYVDDDIDKEPSGSFADAVMKALGPESAPAIPAPEVGPIEATDVASIESPKADPLEENSEIPAPTLSVDDYAPGEETGDVIDMPTGVPLEDYILEEPTFAQNEEDAPFWDCFPSIIGGLDLPSGAVDSSAQQVPSSEGFEDWQGDRETDASGGMMWSCDLGSSVSQPQHPQQDEPSGGPRFLDIMELLDSDDVLPPLEEELESSSLSNDSERRVALPNFGENVNQQLRGRGPARARVRAARQLPTSEEAQHRARRSNDGLFRYEATPQPRMSNTNFSSPEVPSQAREDSTSANVTGSAPGRSANLFDAYQPSSSSDLASSAPGPGSGISGVPSSEDNPFAFQDSFFDFPLDDELFNMASEYEECEFSPAAPPQLDGDQGSSEGNRPPPEKPVKDSQSAVSDGSPRFSSSPQEGPSKEAKPVSKPLAGLMKLLGSLPALPASAAECGPHMKPLQANGEVASSYSSIHLSAVTVTCTSSADGAQKVQAAVTDCRLQGDAQGVYQQVLSGSWQTQGGETLQPLCANCDTAAGSGGLQRRVTRGSNSGFVFVFVLGAVSALCWFLLIRGMWRLASHVLTSAF